MPVSSHFKERVQERTERWKREVLERYAPTSLLESLDLDNMRIVLQRVDYPWNLMSSVGVEARAWTIEQIESRDAPSLLLLQNASVWDAEGKEVMLLLNNEFTVIDAQGVCIRTTLTTIPPGGTAATIEMESANETTAIPTADGRTYYVDRYNFGPSFRKPSSVSPFDEFMVYTRRDENGPRWFVPRERDHYPNLELVDQDKQVVLRVGGISLTERLWQSMGGRNLGPRRSLPIRYFDKSVPREVVLFLASRALRAA